MPSTVDTSMYLSIISWDFFMRTSTDKLVNFPVLDCVVLITAPMQSKALATSLILLGSVGTINLNKYCEGKSVFISNSTLSRSKNSAVFWAFSLSILYKIKANIGFQMGLINTSEKNYHSAVYMFSHFFNSKLVYLSLPHSISK